MSEARDPQGPDGRRNVASGSPFERVIGFSRAVRVGDRVLVSGTAPVWPDGSCDADAGKQAERCLQIIDAALAEAGASLGDVVRTRMFLVDAADADAVGRPCAGVRRRPARGHDGGRGGAARCPLAGGDRGRGGGVTAPRPRIARAFGLGGVPHRER